MDDYNSTLGSRFRLGQSQSLRASMEGPLDTLRETLFGGKSLKQIERAAVEYALERNGGNKSAAARALRVPIATFKRMLKRYEREDGMTI